MNWARRATACFVFNLVAASLLALGPEAGIPVIDANQQIAGSDGLSMTAAKGGKR